jgi:endonuclease YncB( thermonuclease family)
MRRLVPAFLIFGTIAGVSVVQNSSAGMQSFIDRTSRTHSNISDRLIEGRASVIDGDTIEIHGQRIRFNGIDAPESKQSCQDANARTYACGREAARALDTFLTAAAPTRCSFVEWDQYGRFVGDCRRADGASVQEWLVENGHALDWPRYSNGAYSRHQDRAKNNKFGIWQGEFQAPWEWRLTYQSAGETEVSARGSSVSLTGSAGCKIKGNINARGERIYHLPGQENYGKTRISESRGERWFCNEDEARRSGWRRAKR